MKKTIVAMLCLLGSTSAFAGLSTNFSLVTDYVWRGVTQTDNDAAVQGGMDYEHDIGLSLGTWLSNVGTGGTEADFYGSYSYSFTDSFSLSVGGTFYHYTKIGGNDTMELNMGITLWMFDLSANYIDEYFGSKSSSWYYSISTSYDLIPSQGIALGLSVGHTTFDKESLSGSTAYWDYKVSLDRTMDKFTVGLFYTDTNRKTTDGTTETKVDDGIYGASVSRSF